MAFHLLVPPGVFSITLCPHIRLLGQASSLQTFVNTKFTVLCSSCRVIFSLNKSSVYEANSLRLNRTACSCLEMSHCNYFVERREYRSGEAQSYQPRLMV